MKNFKINFSHPIKGVLRLFKEEATFATHIIAVDTDESESLDVPLIGIAKGDWNLVLSWEFEEKQYSYKRMIAIS